MKPDLVSNVRGPSSVIFGSQVAFQLCYCRREMKYASQQCCDETMDHRMALNRE